MPDRPDFLAGMQTALEFLSTGLGQPYKPLWWLWAGATVLLSLFCIRACVRAWAANPIEKPRALALLSFLAAIVGLALGLAWGRSRFGEGMGLSRRYVTLAAPLFCWSYLVAALYFRRLPASVLQVVLALAASFMLYPNSTQGLAYAQSLHDGKIGGFLTDLRGGMPLFALTNRYSRYPRALAVPEFRARMGDCMVMLKEAGVGEFPLLCLDPAYRTVPAATELNYARGSYQTRLDHAQLVYAVKMRYRFRYKPRHDTPNASVILTWRAATPTGADLGEKGFEEPMLQEEAENSLILWVNETLSEFTIYPDNKTNICDILAVEVLVPA
jgi:hypothetical protein